MKFYTRSKSYGFIVADSDVLSQEDGGDVWIHRVGFITPPEIAVEEYTTRPYLLKGERVKFRVKNDPARNSLQATDLTYEDGSMVPLFRKK